MQNLSWNEKRQRGIRQFLWAAVLLGFVVSLWSVLNRWKVESRNHRVEITLDYVEVEKIAQAEHLPLDAVLKRFKQAGVTSIALQEETLAQLEEQRFIISSQTPGQDSFSVFLTPGQRIESSATAPFRARLRAIRDALQVKTGVNISLDLSEGSLNPLEVAGPYNLIRAVGIGLNPEIVHQIQANGLNVIGRVGNYNGVRPAGIAWTLRQVKDLGITTVIFSGDEILGFKGYITADSTSPIPQSTVSLLEKFGLNVGTVEFGKQKGELPLAKAAEDRVIRVHTVTGTEMVQADINSNIQRFLLGARERNIRLLYVRLFLDEKDPLETNAGYVERIATGLGRGLLTTGSAHGYGPLKTPVYLRVGIGIGSAAALLLLIDSVTGLFAGGGPPLLTGLSAAVALLIVLLPAAGLLGAKLAALLAGCLFPTLSILHKDYLRPAASRNPITAALADLLQMSAITAIGIAAVVGLLADRIFLIKADAFIGVKATLIVPLLLVTVVYALGLRAHPGRPFGKTIAEAIRSLVNVSQKPVYLYQVIVSLIVLAAVALLVMRSGNDPGVGVSSFELKLRAILDQLLYARPRFKEMFGHAVMMLGLVFAAKGQQKWALPLLIIGTVGQASLLNTFCHLHTPILVSLWRAGLGLLFGAALGLLAYFLITIADRKTTSQHVTATS